MLLKGFGATSYKKLTFFTCHKTFFIWAGVDFPLYDDNRQKEDEEEKEEEEEKKEEEKEEEVNVINSYKLVSLDDLIR